MAHTPTLPEQAFIAAAGAAELEVEHDIQVGRYRADFSVVNAPILIELDGHATHKTREQRRADAVRERYLEREGYTVVRFTSDEIFEDATRCIEEVKQLVRVCTREWNAPTAVYVDWLFLDRQYPAVRQFYEQLHPEKRLSAVSLSRVLRSLILWLNLRGDVDVFLCGIPSSFSNSLIELDVLKFLDCQSTSFRVMEVQGEFAAWDLVELLRQTESSYAEYYLVADDPAYPPLLRGGRKPAAAIRRDNESTAMGDIEDLKWQDVAYVLGSALGLRRAPMEL